MFIVTGCTMNYSVVSKVSKGAVLSSTIQGKANTSSWPVTATFEVAPETPLTNDNFIIDNGTIVSLTKISDLVYSIIIEPAADGLVKISLAAQLTGQDSSLSIVIDRQIPTVTLSKSFGIYTGQKIVTLEVTNSEDVVGLEMADFVVTNGNILGISGSKSSYSLQIEATNEGEVLVSLPANTIKDEAENLNLASNSLSWFYDLAPPTISISVPGGSPTVTTPILIEFISNEALVGFDSSDIMMTNGTLGNLTQVDSTHWTAEITPSAEGPITASIASGAFKDLLNYPNSESSSLSVTFNTIPSVSLSPLTTYTTTSTVNVTATFNEVVTGFSAADLSLTNATATVSGSGTVYTIVVTPTSLGSFSVQIPATSATDAFGNGNTASNTVTSIFDNVPPTGVISADAGYYNFDSPIGLTLIMNEPVTGLSSADFTVTGGTVSAVGTGSFYSLTFFPTGTGVKSIYLKANSVQDSAGNQNTSISNTENFYYDNTAVTISVNEHEQSALENDSLAKAFTVQMSATKPYDVNVYYRLQGTAVEGTDHNLPTTNSIRIPAGQTTVTTSFNINADSSSSVNKFFQLNLYATNTPAATFTKNYQSRFAIKDVNITRPTPTLISLSNENRCFISSNNKLKCWGNNTSGQVGDGTTTTYDQPVDVDAGTDYSKISVGKTHTCGLSTTGEVKCWGDNAYGKLGNNTTITSSAPVSVATGYSNIFAGGDITCGIKAGDVYCWGNNASTGAMGNGTTTGTVLVPTLSFNGTYDFIDLAVGVSHVCAVDTNQDLYCWGSNSSGQLGDNSTTVRPSPVLIGNGYVKVKTQSTNYIGYHTCGLKDTGAIFCWGKNYTGQLGDNSTVDRLVPTAVFGAYTFSDLSVGTLHTCGLLTSGGVMCWGSNIYNWNPVGGLGNGDLTGTFKSQPQTVVDSDSYTQISSGWNATCGITTSNKLKCWGELNRGFLADPSANIRLNPAISDFGESYSGISSGPGAPCGITSTGALKCWGGDPTTPYPGGDGTTILRTSPVEISHGRTYTSISSGSSHRCGIRDTGSLYCWGTNSTGRLGDGTGTSRLLPFKIDSGIKYLQVSANGTHSCGITDAHILKCWGYNIYGQLGDGTNLSKGTPTIIDSGVLYQKVAAGSNNACAITNDGALKCWGYNYYGAVGDGTNIDKKTPVVIMNGTTFIDVSAGSDYACAISSTKALYCWGTGSDFRLGNGSTSNQNSPQLIASGTQFDTIAAGATSTCAIRSSDKRVMCWGSNGPFGVLTGALGNNNIAASTPTLTSDTDSYISISNPAISVCGITINHVLKCWGHNRYGGLANASVFRMWGTPVDITGWALQ